MALRLLEWAEAAALRSGAGEGNDPEPDSGGEGGVGGENQGVEHLMEPEHPGEWIRAPQCVDDGAGRLGEAVRHEGRDGRHRERTEQAGCGGERGRAHAYIEVRASGVGQSQGADAEGDTDG